MTEKELNKIIDKNFGKDAKIILTLVEYNGKGKIHIHNVTRNLYPFEVLGLTEEYRTRIIEEEKRENEI